MSGRTCSRHPEGCGKSVQVGDILKCSKEEKEFEQEVFLKSRFEEISGMKVEELKFIIKNIPKDKTQRAKGTKKADLMQFILELEGEEFGLKEHVLKLKKWKETVFKVVDIKTSCTLGYVAKTFIKIYGDSLDGCFARVISLKKDSTFKSERADGNHYGGVCVVQECHITFT